MTRSMQMIQGIGEMTSGMRMLQRTGEMTRDEQTAGGAADDTRSYLCIVLS